MNYADLSSRSIAGHHKLLMPFVHHRRVIFAVAAVAGLILYSVALYKYELPLLFALGVVLGLVIVSWMEPNWVMNVLFIYLFVVVGAVEQLTGSISRAAFWINYGLIIVLFAKAMIHSLRLERFNGTTIVVLSLLFIGWCTLSTLMNKIPTLVFLAALKDYVKYMLLFFAIANLDLSGAQLKTLVLVILGIVILQIPVVTTQFLMGSFHVDQMGGTFGLWGTGQLMVWIVIAISGVLAYAQFKKGSAVGPVLLAIALFLVPVFGSSRAVYFFLPITLTFLIFHVFVKQYIWRFVSVALVSACLAAAFLVASGTSLSGIIQNALPARSVEQLYSADIGAKTGPLPGRVFDIIVTYDFVTSDLDRSIVGTGFGATKKSMVEDVIHSGPSRMIVRSQITTTLLEVGFIGLVLYCFVILKGYRDAKKFFKSESDPFWKSVAVAALAAVFMHVAASFYHGNWYTVYSSFPFWFLLGVIYRRRAQA